MVEALPSPADTRTLTDSGAPECWPRHPRGKVSIKQAQKIDTWSLGCVLSSVATWINLGPVYYKEKYQRFREISLDDIIEKHKSSGILEGPELIDKLTFHDGKEVLKAVKAWHSYLVHATRKSDTITDQVLKLVEDHMLQSLPENRLSFEELVPKLDSIVTTARTLHGEAVKLDPAGHDLGDTLTAFLAKNSVATSFTQSD